MAITTRILVVASQPLLSISRRKKPWQHQQFYLSTHHHHHLSHLTLSTTTKLSFQRSLISQRSQQTRTWRVLVAPEQAVTSDTVTSSQIEGAQEIVSSSGDDGTVTIIQALLFIAFVALSILTVGVIYIGVTDFLEKREREKFDKEEEAQKKKKGGKKGKVRARAGPRGFGQKLDDDEDDDDFDLADAKN